MTKQSFVRIHVRLPRFASNDVPRASTGKGRLWALPAWRSAGDSGCLRCGEKRDAPQLMRVVFCPHCGDCEDVLRNVYGRHCLRRSRVCRRMKQNGRALKTGRASINARRFLSTNPPRSPQRERLRKRV